MSIPSLLLSRQFRYAQRSNGKLTRYRALAERSPHLSLDLLSRWTWCAIVLMVFVLESLDEGMQNDYEEGILSVRWLITNRCWIDGRSRSLSG